MLSLRQQAANLFLETLHAIDIPAALRTRITTHPLTIDHHPYPSVDRVLLIALGKAATPMAQAAMESLTNYPLEGILVSPTPLEGLDYFPASHPLPTQASLDAAQAILTLLATATPTTLVLFLISGGASAMVEQPLGDFTLEDTIALNKALVHSGLPIAQMNTLRKHFSAVKGGRLALAAAPAFQHTLLISDVPADHLEIIASGPSLPDPTTVEDCHRIIQNITLAENLHSYFASPNLEETPKSTHPAFAKARWSALLSSDDLCREAARLATAAGFHTVIDNTCDDWDHREAATYLLARLEALRHQHLRTCLISAGELSVQLPPHHGTGGRNQQFTLECARQIAANPHPTAVLSCGSDGIDGNSPAAGAVVDETTWHRATHPAEHLATYNAYPLFAALADTIQTGPTNNNLRDLRILFATPSPSSPRQERSSSRPERWTASSSIT
jgi:glycerate 2-kinase